MSLADRLSEQEVIRKGPPCTVAAIIARLDDRDRDALLAALWDKMVTLRKIHSDLIAEGFAVSVQTLSRHRRGDCACLRYEP